jgi:hypothetical protein
LTLETLHKMETTRPRGPVAPTITAMGVWFGVAVVVAALIAIGLLTTRLRSVQAAVDESWQQVLLALRRRHGLAGELTEAVRRASGGQIDMVDRIREASEVADLPGASPEQQVTAERELEMALAALSETVAGSAAVADDAHVTALRARLDDTDHRIEARRSVYQRGVDALHRRTASIPNRWVARALGIHAGPLPSDE